MSRHTTPLGNACPVDATSTSGAASICAERDNRSGGQQIAQSIGRKARGVASQQHESRPAGRQFGAQGQQSRQVLGQPPYLAMRAVPVTGRIENHGIIAVAAADLALDEFHGVFGDPANGRTAKAESSALCLAQATMFRAASTCVTAAPAAAAASVLPPV